MLDNEDGSFSLLVRIYEGDIQLVQVKDYVTGGFIEISQYVRSSLIKEMVSILPSQKSLDTFKKDTLNVELVADKTRAPIDEQKFTI